MSIVQIAERAGVSSSTVSRVINNRPRVSRRAKLAVTAAMREMNYTPSDNRPGPKLGPRTSSRVPTIAILILGPSCAPAAPAFGELMQGISRGASEFGANLIFRHVRDEEDLPTQLGSGEIDGALLHSSLVPTGVDSQLGRLPTVWLMGNRKRPEWGDQVMADPYAIGELAAQYLISRGHRNLAYLNLNHGHWPFRAAALSFSDIAEQSNVPVSVLEAEGRGGEFFDSLKYSAEAGDRLVQRLVNLPSRPTGLFVADDLQVALLQPALQRAGVEIGSGGVEVISCNNERPYLIGLSPAPAEIDIHAQSIGHRGVERLLWRINNPDVAQRMVTLIRPSVVDHDGNPFDVAQLAK